MLKYYECTILFNNSPSNAHISQILAGYKLLENQGMLRIKSVSPCTTFRSSGNYEHNSIVEVEIGGKKIVYDMADGYQSIHRKSVFDSQLDRVDFYFKRSYDKNFHFEMKNRDKVKPLGLNYHCTCKRNPYDKFAWNGVSVAEFKRFFKHSAGLGNRAFGYTKFESNGLSYSEYKLLFLARVWDSSGMTIKGIKQTYPYFSDAEAKAEYDSWKYSLDIATKNRINYIRVLKEHFGDKVIAGISRDAFAQKVCPDLIIDDEIANKLNYISMIKQNCICIASEGLHRSIGWKFAEYIAAGKAVVTEPPAYEIPYGFAKNQNYLEYSNAETLIASCEELLFDVNKVYLMEQANRNYYKEHLAPDKVVLDSLRTAEIMCEI